VVVVGGKRLEDRHEEGRVSEEIQDERVEFEV